MNLEQQDRVVVSSQFNAVEALNKISPWNAIFVNDLIVEIDEPNCNNFGGNDHD
jgi:hypothetical protein